MTSQAQRALPLLIADITQAAAEIVQYCAVERDEFLHDRMRQRAIIQCFEVIGEATKKLPPDFRNEHPDVPWRAMAGFRDNLIHDYFEVDRALLWSTATKEIPALLARFNQMSNEQKP